jgi:LuxR family transcriptional regulator, maltose regulon positive regulatory protein
MAESPMTSPPETARYACDVLLATKLHVPRPRPGFVPRPRLLARLAEGKEHELVLVCTPAGFGKTTLLADWVRSGQRPVAWLSLDEGDNDPARFWRHVAAALDEVRPGIAELVAALLGDLQSASLESVVATLVNQLAGVTDELALVLDDYHLIQASVVHASLGFLLEHLPACLRLVLASRADPPLPLARLRGRGQLDELREADLRFTPKEAAALLRTTVGSDLPEAVVAALAERTEGWVAGLQLAGLSLRGHADPAAFVATFSGSYRYVVDYLAEEVLDRQPEQLRGFLLETSVLERLCAPLCDAVCGRTDSQALLEQVEQANLFLAPLDEERRWWRYHHLFADLLRARLAREQPERLSGLHHAAAAWCEQRGLVDDAIRHALAAGEAVWAARLIERHFDELVWRAEGATVDRWVQALPAELVRARPRLCVVQALWAVIDARVEQAERLLGDAAAALMAGGEEEPYQPSVGRAASLVANLPAAIAIGEAAAGWLRGDAERMAAFGQQALAHLGEDDRAQRRLADWSLANAHHFRGQPAEAEDALVGVVAEQRAAGRGDLPVRAACILGQVRRARGRLGAALRTYQEALEIVGRNGQPLPLSGMAYVGIAEVLYERGELAEALDHATKGVHWCRQLAYTQPLREGLAVLARVRQALGDPAGALAAIGEATELDALSPAVVDLINPVPVVGARLALARGEVAVAARWVQARGLAPDDQLTYPREREYLLLARLLLATDAPSQALGLLERLHTQAAAQGRVDSVIKVRALQALALNASGEEPAVLTALAEAVTLAAPEGYLRVFVDEGAPMAGLLGTLITTPAIAQPMTAVHLSAAYQGRLLRAFEQAGHRVLARPGHAAAMPGLAGRLSARELEVLGLLATGKSNQAIAEELVISIDTVKRHVTHILSKLGVANRIQAVVRARELRLLR